MERLQEPDSYLKAKLSEFVINGDFGYASGARGNGYSRVWFRELLPQEEISFDSDVYLLLPQRAQELKAGVHAVEVASESTEAGATPGGKVVLVLSSRRQRRKLLEHPRYAKGHSQFAARFRPRFGTVWDERTYRN